jgi:hypothetical protein
MHMPCATPLVHQYIARFAYLSPPTRPAAYAVCCSIIISTLPVCHSLTYGGSTIASSRYVHAGHAHVLEIFKNFCLNIDNQICCLNSSKCIAHLLCNTGTHLLLHVPVCPTANLYCYVPVELLQDYQCTVSHVPTNGESHLTAPGSRWFLVHSTQYDKQMQ